jgi:Leucine-rich repeat (LRR) protein
LSKPTLNIKKIMARDCISLEIGSPESMDFLSSSLLGLCSLTNLDLAGCNLKAIPNDIGCLFSLTSLYLSGNNFVSLPESMCQLSNLKWMQLNNCTSLRSLSKLPLNIEVIGANNCISLEMLPDLFKNDSLGPTCLTLQNCFKLPDNQDFNDMFLARIKKHLQVSLSLGLSRPRIQYQIVIPGSEIPEWFSHQRNGADMNVKEPVHLQNEWMGMAVCTVVYTQEHYQIHKNNHLSFYLKANGTQMFSTSGSCITTEVLSDHHWLFYSPPPIYNEKGMELFWECDANGFTQIDIRIETTGSALKEEKCGFRMVYKNDIEDLNRIMVQCSNNNITPYEGIDVVHHNFDNSAVAIEVNKIKRSRDDYDGIGPSGEGSSNDIPNPKRIQWLTELMAHGNSDCKESSDSD